MNNELAKYILQRQYHLKSTGVPISKHKRLISETHVGSPINKAFEEAEFRITWAELYHLGLVDRK